MGIMTMFCSPHSHETNHKVINLLLKITFIS